MDVEEFTVKLAADVPPKLIPDTLLKLVPVMVIVVPPVVVAVPGETVLTLGRLTGAWKVYWLFVLILVLPIDVTIVTSTVPAEWAGATAVIEVGDVTVYEAASEFPNKTADTALKPEPLMVIGVPPPSVLPR